MDISDKIKKIRENSGLTQEEFAKILYVSRTAVSKWELKKGYPSIDSLKLISKNFNISFDELLTNDDLIDICEKDINDKKEKNKNLIIAVLDLFSIFILFLPLFSEKVGEKYLCLPLFYCKDIGKISQLVYLITVFLTFTCGIVELIALKIENPKLNKILFIISFVLSIMAVVMFIECRQIYVTIFMFALLVIKGFFSIKTK